MTKAMRLRGGKDLHDLLSYLTPNDKNATEKFHITQKQDFINKTILLILQHRVLYIGIFIVYKRGDMFRLKLGRTPKRKLKVKSL